MRESRTPGSVEGLPSQGGSLLDQIKDSCDMMLKRSVKHLFITHSDMFSFRLSIKYDIINTLHELKRSDR